MTIAAPPPLPFEYAVLAGPLVAAGLAIVYAPPQRLPDRISVPRVGAAGFLLANPSADVNAPGLLTPRQRRVAETERWDVVSFSWRAARVSRRVSFAVRELEPERVLGVGRGDLARQLSFVHSSRAISYGEQLIIAAEDRDVARRGLNTDLVTHLHWASDTELRTWALRRMFYYERTSNW